ncbi:MAG: VOC family protein [Desulfobacterales bacterium]|jgi:catechol 2,3-dioxygenase-like lactoylglutathione lyase family enzyme|nr:VOC family protein [Desulfobacterales bacterium]
MEIKFTHVRLLVKDYQLCFRFYRDMLGFKAIWGDESGGYADFETGSAIIALFGRNAMADAIGKSGLPFEAAAQDTVSLIFEVPNVDEATQELKAKGVVFETEPTDRSVWGIRTAHFRDPDGNLIEINHALSESENE